MPDAAPAREPFHVLCKPIGPKCNLNCEYCFYLKKEDLFPDHNSMKDFRMDDETLENFVKQYIQAQHPQAPEVNFAWQGGEPTLLGIDFFKRVVELQEKYKRDNQKISNAFQTNGVLLNDDWAQLFKEHDFLIGISIDGPKEIHDHFRKDWGGKGSFDRVMAGLETLKRNKVEFNTLTVVQNYNGDYPRDIYRFLKKIGSTFFQFIPIVEPLPEGGVSERTVRPEQFGNFMCRILDEWIKGGDIGRIYIQQFELMISLALGYPSSMCVHSRTCGRSVAMEHNGNLYSCDHFVNPEDFLGNIADTPLNLLMDGGKQTKFGRDKYDTLPQYCLKCKYLRYCYGACPSDRVKNTPDGEPGLNHNCEGYYQFYDYSLPYFNAMAECLKRGLPAIEYPRFMENKSTQPKAADGSRIGRNDPCPCGSGKKYKKCCARK